MLVDKNTVLSVYVNILNLNFLQIITVLINA